jgi:hypothetical protein
MHKHDVKCKKNKDSTVELYLNITGTVAVGAPSHGDEADSCAPVISTVPTPGSEEKQRMDVPNQMQESCTQTRGDAGIGLAGCYEVRLFPYTV